MQFSSLIRDIIHFPALLFARTSVYWKAYSRIRKVRKLRITPHVLHLRSAALIPLPRLLSHLPSEVSFYPMVQFILLLLTVWLCLYPRIDNERKYNKCKQDWIYTGCWREICGKNQWRGVVDYTERKKNGIIYCTNYHLIIIYSVFFGVNHIFISVLQMQIICYANSILPPQSS